MTENKQMTPEEYRQIPATVEAIREFIRNHDYLELREFEEHMTPEQTEAYRKAVRIIMRNSKHY